MSPDFISLLTLLPHKKGNMLSRFDCRGKTRVFRITRPKFGFQQLSTSDGEKWRRKSKFVRGCMDYHGQRDLSTHLSA